MQNHNSTNNKNRRRKSSLTKYLPLTLLQGFEKVIQSLRVRESWRPNRNGNILTATLMAVNVVSFSHSRCSTGGSGPTLLGDGFLYCILLASSPDLNSSGPQGPSALCGFPYHNSSILLLQLSLELHLTSVLTELYNSSTPTRYPTRSLKSHVWSSSSGNNCHEVHRSLSSGASVYECTMGIF